mmetsp:Transcript_16464/g.23226  ORF Transcript_16464/g.23226 Transcript_16464/m.23226 type:complete len:454 (-) Transcript_16464:125-1486(-)
MQLSSAKMKKRLAAACVLFVCLGYHGDFVTGPLSDFFLSATGASMFDHRRMAVMPVAKRALHAETSFLARLPMITPFGKNHEEEPQVDQQSLRGDNQRYLSRDLGNGDCEWTPPVPLDPEIPVDSTFLVGFPGSGKRLTYLLLEALTGSYSGDDWDHSGNGYHVTHMKGAYPHHESTAWFWGSQMGQTVLQVRNPRWALPSYRTVRHELAYAGTWGEAHDRIEFVYTERGPTDRWDNWKASSFKQEMQIWSWFIDYWMEGGLRRKFDHELILVGDNETVVDEHCNGDLVCEPKTVVSFENMINPATGPTELGKIANVMTGKEGVDMISSSTWGCLYTEVLAKGTEYETRFNPYRDEKGPKRAEKTLTSKELAFMLDEVEYIHDKYSAGEWASDPAAQQLVGYMTNYISLISSEYAIIIMQEEGGVSAGSSNSTEQVEVPPKQAPGEEVAALEQ